MVRIGVVGCGVIGKTHCSVIKELPNAELVAVADIVEESAKSYAEEFGCEYYTDHKEMLKRDDIDMISVCVPSGAHHLIAIDAANAGKHILVEKPIDITIENAEAIIKAAKDNHVKLSCIVQHRFDPLIVELRKIFDSGAMGKLLMGSSRTIWYRPDEYYKGTWRGTLDMDGGGAIMNQSIHLIDLLLSFMGPVESVYSNCATLAHDIEAEDAAFATLRFEENKIGSIEGTTAAYPGHYTELCLYAENGSVIIRDDHLAAFTCKGKEFPELDQWKLTGNEVNRAGSNLSLDPTSHAIQYRDVLEAIEQDREPAVTGEKAMAALKVILAMYESSRKGEVVKF